MVKSMARVKRAWRDGRPIALGAIQRLAKARRYLLHRPEKIEKHAIRRQRRKHRDVIAHSRLLFLTRACRPGGAESE